MHQPALAAELLADQRGAREDGRARLDGAPLLLPGVEASVRGPLLRWIEAAGLRPRIVGEFDDSALMRAFAEAGAGIFPSASLVGEQLCRQGGLVHLGDANGVTETYYAISVERRLTHPAVRAISEGAHAKQNFA